MAYGWNCGALLGALFLPSSIEGATCIELGGGMLRVGIHRRNTFLMESSHAFHRIYFLFHKIGGNSLEEETVTCDIHYTLASTSNLNPLLVAFLTLHGIDSIQANLLWVS